MDRRPLAAALMFGLVLLLAAGAAYYAWREQRAANQEILARLDEVRATLAGEATRSRDLAAQVAALAGRVARLETDNRELRRQVARLLSRRPPDVARLVVPAPLEVAALTPLAEHATAAPPDAYVEVIPITWTTVWRAYQPAGLIAPAPAVVVTRRLADPAFLRKLYVGYVALQAADVTTTLTALSRGAREANPLLKQSTGNPAAFIGLKAATSVATVFSIEALRKRHPVAATVTLIAINATLAAVVVNNVSVAINQQPR